MKALTPIAATTLFILTLSGCGQASSFALPDDPRTEEQAIAEEGTGDAQFESASVARLKNPSFTQSEEAQVLAKYSYLDPQNVVPTRLLKSAILYFEANKDNFANQNYISVIDFSRHSSRARLFIVDMRNGSVWPLHTSHGKGSDSNHDGLAESFGNKSGSGKSSLGFYRTAETYPGKHGYSLRLDGLSSTNSNARARAIVIHAADYVVESNVKLGRSLGCPAITPVYSTKVINKLKQGSLIYAGLSSAQ